MVVSAIGSSQSMPIPSQSVDGRKRKNLNVDKFLTSISLQNEKGRQTYHYFPQYFYVFRKQRVIKKDSTGIRNGFFCYVL